jgi:hypothetical protein
METLSRLVIRAHCTNQQEASVADLNALRRDLRYVAALGPTQLKSFLTLANNHHVIVRALTVLQNVAALENGRAIADCEHSLASEHARIDRAIAHLQMICAVLEAKGCKVAVIKSLDHWPDLGSDLDLCTLADHRKVAEVMREELDALPVARSWGDRLANKWNYSVPGLPEWVEIHVQYLGQTGEHAQLVRRVLDRATPRTVLSRSFLVPAAEERIMISTLQRLYRHFYYRLCDMVDFTSLLQANAVDFIELQRAADCAGIWAGVATFLCLILNYVQPYGVTLPLPDGVASAAYFPGSGVRFQDGFLRVPKKTAAALYFSQLLQAGRRRDRRALRRLPLLLPLAVSALLAQRLSGSDKGIW